MPIALALLLAACAGSRSIAQMREDDWAISEPVEAQAVANEGSPDALSFERTWAQFLAQVEPGDELRRVSSNRAGKGFAILRDGRLVALYLVTIY